MFALQMLIQNIYLQGVIYILQARYGYTVNCNGNTSESTVFNGTIYSPAMAQETDGTNFRFNLQKTIQDI